MSLRPAKCYRTVKRPWTRQSQKKPRKGYVKGVPDNKIHKFEDGNAKKKFNLRASLVAMERFQIRHNALEAGRVSALKQLEEIGVENYLVKVLVFPHHVLRENAMATGAGADRFQTGMRQSFGSPVGTAAQAKPNQPILYAYVDASRLVMAKRAMKVASSKMPGKYKIVIENMN